MQNPEEIVAERIIARIKKEKLIPDDRLDSFKKKLLTGQLKKEDWRFLVGLTVTEEDSEDE